ncbi:hypothetical protein D3C71_1649750 [compost metagenome]
MISLKDGFIIFVLPDTLIQLLLIIFLVVAIGFYIYSWRVERRKIKAVHMLDDLVTMYERRYNSMFENHNKEDV